jgi:hypothetical protein
MDGKANHYARCGQNNKTNLQFLDFGKEIKNASSRDFLGLVIMLRK